MKVGKYQIGRFHGIIKKVYEDGSFDYETSFTDARDLYLSVDGLNRCLGMLVGIATDHPKVLKQFSIIRGKEEIIKELSSTK